MSKIVFFGSPAPAADCLRGLASAGHEVLAAYTQPDRVAGRSKNPVPTPVKTAAEELGIDARAPRSLREEKEQERLAALGADAFVVVAYGRILPPAVLDMPPLGVLNVHPSLLPRYRGPSPVVTAILEGASETGVTVMLLDEGMDTGPILAQSEPILITEEDTAGELTERLFRMGGDLLLETLSRWESGELAPQPQDDAQATVTRLIEKSDGELDFSRPAVELARAVRAFDPWPGTFTHWDGKLLKVLEARAGEAPEDAVRRRPGTVTGLGDRVLIAAGEGALSVTRLQLEGRKPVGAREFLSGFPRIDGQVLPS
ncbi:MAG: methionyl-tRNA formyltransferase [Chloroflexota bacterium]